MKNPEKAINAAIFRFCKNNKVKVPGTYSTPMPGLFGDMKHLKGKYCIYFLVNSGEITYIGYTNSPYTRTRSHKNTITFDWVFCAICENEIIAKCLEFSAIQKLKPKLNSRLKYKRATYTIYSSVENAYLAHGMVRNEIISATTSN